MKTIRNLADLKWTLTGFTPHQWGWCRSMETGVAIVSEIAPVPAKVPGSVQRALREAGLLPDWNVGMNSRECEWVENRHWIYEALVPDGYFKKGFSHRLCCLGLDGSGWVLVNGVEVAKFANSFIPHYFGLNNGLKEKGNRIQIVFDCSSRWLGQFGYTSQMTQWKPRFNYTWDWMPRLVQIGVWDGISLEVSDGKEIRDARCWTDGDSLYAVAKGGRLRLTLKDGDKIIKTEEFGNKIVWKNLPVERWWPNGQGSQKLYDVTCELIETCEIRSWRVGFKSVEWRQCEAAPENAEPWICAVNGKPVFLQGIDWTPIRPNFADLAECDYRKLLTLYRDMGCNVLRVWGGAVLEKEVFYDMCDEFGLMVWQEFPLSSAGLENWPPEDAAAIEDMGIIAASYISRRQHHASLLLWCGGNELQGSLDGDKTGVGKPVDNTHPLMARFKSVVEKMDPGRRFLPTSASGPRFVANKKEFGKGLHWDVHGPWNYEPKEYWENDDALFRSEVGFPGASSAKLIRKHSGGLPKMPANLDNPLWRRTAWWIQWDDFLKEKGCKPRNLDEFVQWSQKRQADGLALAVRTCKSRFPKCGGVILWMGHDAFPCTANTSI
ncbi:MAG: glycoside hydrolase family 2 TIM barrel-domain containing protein, partial [Victivallales bacterium]